MPRYRVTLTLTTVEIIEAPNPYQAAILASDRGGGDVEVASVTPAVGRPTAATGRRPASKTAKKTAKKTVKKARKKRRPLSPEARAKLAQNLVKARAARAAKHKSAQQSATKKTRTAKKVKAASKKR